MNILGKSIGCLWLCLCPLTPFAQSGAGQETLKSDYDGVAATYAVLKAGNGQNVVIKYRNATGKAAAIIITLTGKEGRPEQKTFKINAYENLVDNIGDVQSFLVSFTFMEAGKELDKMVINQSVDKENIYVRNGLLLATRFDKKKAPVTGQPPAEAPGRMTDEQVVKTFELVFGKAMIRDWKVLEEDREVAQLLLKELVEKTCQLSVAKALLETSFAFDPSILDIVQAIASNYSEDCSAARKGTYYQSVIGQVRAHWRTALQTRVHEDTWSEVHKN